MGNHRSTRAERMRGVHVGERPHVNPARAVGADDGVIVQTIARLARLQPIERDDRNQPTPGRLNRARQLRPPVRAHPKPERAVRAQRRQRPAAPARRARSRRMSQRVHRFVHRRPRDVHHALAVEAHRHRPARAVLTVLRAHDRALRLAFARAPRPRVAAARASRRHASIVHRARHRPSSREAHREHVRLEHHRLLVVVRHDARLSSERRRESPRPRRARPRASSRASVSRVAR
mmetsp:Transcript_8193/g.32727  ORF Transcript_8193/g.32727 Transcript_8193/m.32727 type:complete len:234 (+) Transcript_8193:4199-4900(+)